MLIFILLATLLAILTVMIVLLVVQTYQSREWGFFSLFLVLGVVAVTTGVFLIKLVLFHGNGPEL